VGRLVPKEIELPGPETAERQVVILVREAPLGAPELAEKALVGARQAQVGAQQEEPGAHVPVFFELRTIFLRGTRIEVEPPAGLDASLDVDAAQLGLRRGHVGLADDEEREHDQ
jgi:hypothetical protein